MKKITLLLVLFLASLTMASAQWYVGGSFGFTTSKLNVGEHSLDGSSFKFLPEFGFNFSDNLSFGATVGYMKGYAALGSVDPSDIRALLMATVSTLSDLGTNPEEADELPFSTNIKLVRVAPYARYSLLKKNNFELFVDGILAYNMIKVHESEDNVIGLELSARPGLAYILSDNFKLTAKVGSLGFQHLKLGDYKLNRFGLDIDASNILFGLQYYF